MKKLFQKIAAFLGLGNATARKLSALELAVLATDFLKKIADNKALNVYVAGTTSMLDDQVLAVVKKWMPEIAAILRIVPAGSDWQSAVTYTAHGLRAMEKESHDAQLKEIAARLELALSSPSFVDLPPHSPVLLRSVDATQQKYREMKAAGQIS